MSEDVEDLDDVLDRLVPFRADPVWHRRIELDLREMVLGRPKQRAYLARYGKADMFRRVSSVAELDRAVAVLSEVVKNENELNRAQEDR